MYIRLDTLVQDGCSAGAVLLDSMHTGAGCHSNRFIESEVSDVSAAENEDQANADIVDPREGK